MSEEPNCVPEGAHVRNDLSGDVAGPVVQAQTVHGGVAFHVHSPSPDDSLPRPDQVPPLTVRCVNHANELSFLDASLVDDARGSSGIGFDVVTGMPGVGKTTLVCRWADMVRDRFPGGQLFVDYAALRRRATGSDVSAAVTACLKSLGVRDAFLPESHEELIALFRSRTAGRRILVVLDDVDQAAQVRALVPKGTGSVLLVTSNLKLHELALDGARTLHLEPLDMDSGLRLLAQRCGEEAVDAERDAAERIVTYCDGLPKALQVVATRLVTGVGLTMTRLADELADETARLRGLSLRGAHSVSAALELVYRTLSHNAARLYRALGWIPGRTFDVGTAAVAAHLDTAETEGLLSALEESSLVDMTDDGRFRLHNLVRLHARECAGGSADPETGRRAVVERVATHYLALTAFADRAISQDRLRIGDLSAILSGASDPFAAKDGPDPLAWLEAERTNILPVLRDATRLGLHTHVWQLSEGFTVLFFRRRYLEDWKESLELGVAAAAAAVVPAAEGRLRSLLSRPLMDLKRYEQARSELEKAVACAEVSAHTALRASVQEFFGRYWDRFDPVRAVEAYRCSVELNIEAEEWRGVGIATYFLGCAQDAVGHHEQALGTLCRARQDLLARDDERMAARALAAMGTVHDHLGDQDMAMRDLREAADALVRERATHYAAQAFELLADITQRAGGPVETVREHLLQAHEIYETGGSPKAEELRVRLDGLSGTV